MKLTRLRPSFVVALAAVASMFLVAGLVFGLTESARAIPVSPRAPGPGQDGRLRLSRPVGPAGQAQDLHPHLRRR